MKTKCEICGRWWSDDDGCTGCPWCDERTDAALEAEMIRQEAEIEAKIERELERQRRAFQWACGRILK